MAEFVKVAQVSDIPDQTGKCVQVNGRKIAVFNVGGQFHAIDDECTHVGGPLSEGALTGDDVECPWHGACFNLKTGEATGPPAGDGVSVYPVRVSGQDVEVQA